jgi:hypothetical protein
MKSFANFFKEAVETLASTEAKNRGLVGNGHGDWYDKQGNFVAKTVKGKLKFFGQGDTLSADGVPGEELRKNEPTQTAVNQEPSGGGEGQQQENGIAIVVGRFNPPSKNHESLLRSGYSQANRRGYEYRVYPSRIQDSLTNPLNPTAKIEYLQAMFPKYADYIIDSEESRTIFDILESLYGDGYSDVIVVVGQERLGEFQSIIHKGDGERYQFNNIEVVSSGSKDPDSEVEDPGSSALMRAAAAVNDFDKFQAGLPSGMNSGLKEKLFNSLKKTMEVSEQTEAWKIAPEFDNNGLRWNYKNNGLYQVGTFVENLNTGLLGKIIRRGANYLICVTEDGIMFKSWLKDVIEVHEIGTTEYLNYVQGITPGESIRNFGEFVPQTNPKTINKRRKK